MPTVAGLRKYLTAGERETFLRACEAELACELDHLVELDALPDLAALESRFAPTLSSIPGVTVTLPLPSVYDALLTPSIAAGIAS